MKKQQGNQWALLTNVEIKHENIEVTSRDDFPPRFIQGVGQVRFSGIAPATPQILEAMKRWMYQDDPRFPIYQEEWMCLYCGSPNLLPEGHCSQCGAPRNWLIG